MMRRLLLLTIILLSVYASGRAQVSSQNARRIHSGTAVPAQPCSPGPNFTDFYWRTTTDILYVCTAAPNTWATYGNSSGSGTVTSVSVTTANGVSGSVANSTTTPAITLSLGAITPTKATFAQGALTAASNPFISHTATWNDGAVSFTNIFSNVTDTASDSNSLLMDLQVGGSSRFSVSKAGGVVAFAGLTASSIISNSDSRVGAANALYWLGRSQITSPADGVNTLFDAANTSYGRLQFGGTTSSYPSLKRSTTSLIFRLADDSADTSFTASTGVLSNVASDAATTNNTLCLTTTTGLIRTGSGANGICLGTSSARYKHDIHPFSLGLSAINRLQPKRFFYNKGYGNNGLKESTGFVAEDVVKVAPHLVGLDSAGRPNSVDYVAIVPMLVNSVKELSAKVDAQQKEITRLKKRLRRR